MFVRSAASTLCGVSIAGPQVARTAAARWCAADLSAAAFKLFQLRQTAVGFAPAILTRAGFTGELGYEIWTTPDYFATLYDELWDAGRSLGLAHFGGRALSSLRLEKGYGSFNKDFRPDYTAAETGLDRFIDFAKADFTGRAAACAERAAGPARRFVIMEVAAADADVIGYESIIRDGAAVGYVTSGALRALHRQEPCRRLCAGRAGARRRALRDRHPGRHAHGHGATAAAVRSGRSAAARLERAR